MKLIYTLATLTILFSCNEKIDLIGDFKETAVVYGLLDHSDSMHYVKITRAFIGPGNALDFAQIADSNYFDVVDATIEEIQAGNILRTWILKDTLIQNKDTNGVFYAPLQKVYYFKTLPTTISSSGLFGEVQTSPNEMMSSLNPQCKYRLKAIINSGEFEVSAETELVNGIALGNNITGYGGFNFAENPGQYKSQSVTVSNVGNAHVLNASIDIILSEFVDNSSQNKGINWQIGEADVTPNTAKTFSANGETFYNLIKNNISDNELINRRNLIGFDITVTGGSEDLYNYMIVNRPSSSLAQNKPTYTNLNVTNDYRVIGIFSSIQTIKFDKPFVYPPSQNVRGLNKPSTQELCEGPITGLLQFCSQHPLDIFGPGGATSYGCD